MIKPPSFDVEAAHRYFSTTCFNGTWDLIDKPERSAQDALAMKAQAIASLWHWMQRPDATKRNLAIGCWQISRVFALLYDGEQAYEFAARSLDYSRDEGAFCIAYAYEALARATSVLKDPEHLSAIAALHNVAPTSPGLQDYLAQAAKLAESIAEEDDRKRLLDDLATISR